MEHWSNSNLSEINDKKSNFIIFTRSKIKFTTRIGLNNSTIDRLKSIKLLGLWITEDISWNKNTKEMCRKAYSRISMLSKLKYVGISQEDLFLIYKLFNRSILEYCSVVYHSSLTEKQSNMIERVQRICLKLILQSKYEDYESALKSCNLTLLKARREQRVLSFSKKALKHPKHQSMFPLSENFLTNPHNLRNLEKYKVNFARTHAYQRSFIPNAQKSLNDDFRCQRNT